MRAVFSLLLISCATTQAQPDRLGASLPAPLTEQKPLPSLIEGRVAIVDLWASWCDPCKETLPKLVRLEQAYAQQNLVVVGINVGETVDTAKRLHFIGRSGIERLANIFELKHGAPIPAALRLPA